MDGRRVLEAQVELTDPCPWCGLSHIYRAADLPCPITGRLGDQPSQPRE
jgi:rubrerythrin